MATYLYACEKIRLEMRSTLIDAIRTNAYHLVEKRDIVEQAVRVSRVSCGPNIEWWIGRGRPHANLSQIVRCIAYAVRWQK